MRKNTEADKDKTDATRLEKQGNVDSPTLLDETDTLLLLAPQKFEADYNESSSDNKDKDDNEILLYLLESFVGSNDAKMVITNNDKELCNKLGKLEGNVRYGSPKTKEKVVEARKGGIPQKTQDQNKWVANLWFEWAQYHLRVPFVKEEERQYELLEDFCKISTQAMNFWLAKFILEVRRRDGKSYSGETLYQVCCGLLRLLKEADRAYWITCFGSLLLWAMPP